MPVNADAVLSGMDSTNQPTTPWLEIPVDEWTTNLSVLSDGSKIEEVTTTQGVEVDYDILIQGSDRKYPAIVIRRKHRGKGATIKTISKFGKYAALYADYGAAIEAYQTRRATRRQDSTTRGNRQDRPATTRDSWVGETLQSVVERSDHGEGSDPAV